MWHTMINRPSSVYKYEGSWPTVSSKERQWQVYTSGINDLRLHTSIVSMTDKKYTFFYLSQPIIGKNLDWEILFLGSYLF